MKRLDQVEPRRALPVPNFTLPITIDAPGSYYLTQNIGTRSDYDGNAIVITASNVTLDLNGFSIIGGGTGSLKGIVLDDAATDCTIKNGSIRGFIEGITANLSGTLIDVTVSFCSARGIVLGRSWKVERCDAHDNGSFGLGADSGSVLSNCTAENNTDDGIRAGYGCSLTNCAARNNKKSGIDVGQKCSLTNCSARANGVHGFVAGSGSILTGCTASENTSNGASSSGIFVGDGGSVIGCASFGNLNTNATPTAGTGTGISAGIGSTIKDSTADQNKGAGIQVAIGSTVMGCTARSNGNDGILAPNDCLITRNSCSQNGTASLAAGIHITSQGNRIEENHVVFNNDTGIKIDDANNLVVRNSSRFNSSNTKNYAIAPNNVVGTIVTTSGTLNSASNSNVNISF
jgi:parallel beta-helix repeat protein